MKRLITFGWVSQLASVRLTSGPSVAAQLGEVASPYAPMGPGGIAEVYPLLQLPTLTWRPNLSQMEQKAKSVGC